MEIEECKKELANLIKSCDKDIYCMIKDHNFELMNIYEYCHYRRIEIKEESKVLLHTLITILNNNDNFSRYFELKYNHMEILGYSNMESCIKYIIDNLISNKDYVIGDYDTFLGKFTFPNDRTYVSLSKVGFIKLALASKSDILHRYISIVNDYYKYTKQQQEFSILIKYIQYSKDCEIKLSLMDVDGKIIPTIRSILQEYTLVGVIDIIINYLEICNKCYDHMTNYMSLCKFLCNLDKLLFNFASKGSDDSNIMNVIMEYTSGIKNINLNVIHKELTIDLSYFQDIEGSLLCPICNIEMEVKLQHTSYNISCSSCKVTIKYNPSDKKCKRRLHSIDAELYNCKSKLMQLISVLNKLKF